MQKFSENPFYGKKAILDLYHSLDGKTLFNTSLLNKAWEEAKDDLELRKGFWSLVFSIGDITDRQHNIFRKKVDGGGHAKRGFFREVLEWMKQNHNEQYRQFLSLIVEYTGWDSLLANRVRTRKKTDKVVEVVSALHNTDLEYLAQFIADYIRSEENSYKLSLLAKRLVRIDNKSPKSSEAKYNRKLAIELYNHLSEKMGWEITSKKNYFSHTGLYKWRGKYIKGMEYYLFSTEEILEMNKEEFIDWLDNTPSSARRRVKYRLTNNEKWSDLKEWYEQWENFKENKQEQYRVLSEKIRQGTATEEDKAKLIEVKKKAKVNTGASNLKKELENLFSTSDERDFNLRAHSLLEKMQINQRILLVQDCSGSMSFCHSFSQVANNVYPNEIASLISTMIGLKNPSDLTDNMMIRFGTKAEMIHYGSTVRISRNRFSDGDTTIIKKLIDREDDFLANYKRVFQVMRASMIGTDLTTVSRLFTTWANTLEKKEELQNYPLMLVISDGEFNGTGTAYRDVQTFMNQMRHLGWNGVLCVWDVCSTAVKRSRLEEISNVVHMVGWSTSILDQIFKNLHDLDVVDSYSVLQSLARSNRYAPVRYSTL